MQKLALKAKKRSILGKKVKNLRKQGLLPATIYGKKIKSESLQVDFKDFSKVFKTARETGLIDLLIENEDKAKPVLIHNIQKDPVSGQVIHADFYQVDLKQKIKAVIPIIAIGEARAVTDNKGVLLHILSEVEVEALPTDLPEKIEVDVSNLGDVDQAIAVKDLSVDKTRVAVLSDGEEVVFKIGPLITKEMEAQLKAEEEAKAAAAAAAAPQAEAGAAPTEAAPEQAEEVKKEEPVKEEKKPNEKQ